MKIAFTIIALFLICYFVGSAIPFKYSLTNSIHEKYALSIVMGFLFMVCIYEIFYLPLFFIRASLKTLNIIYTVVILSLLFVGIYKNITNHFYYKKLDKKPSLLEIVLHIVMFLFITSQIVFFCTKCFHYGYASDDYAYATTTSLALYSNKIISSSSNEITLKFNAHYTLSCWEIWTTWPCWLFNNDVAVTLHLIISIFILVNVYLVYYLISNCLFKENDNKLLFMILSIYITWYGYYNWASISGQIIATPWYGRSIMFIVSVPLLLYFVITHKKELSEYRYFVIIDIFAGCCLSMTGMMTIGFSLFCIFLSFLTSKEYDYAKKTLILETIPSLFLLTYIIF